jgi:hypothetical protein
VIAQQGAAFKLGAHASAPDFTTSIDNEQLPCRRCQRQSHRRERLGNFRFDREASKCALRSDPLEVPRHGSMDLLCVWSSDLAWGNRIDPDPM